MLVLILAKEQCNREREITEKSMMKEKISEAIRAGGTVMFRKEIVRARMCRCFLPVFPYLSASSRGREPDKLWSIDPQEPR